MNRLNSTIFSLVCLLLLTTGRGYSQNIPAVTAMGHISAEVIPVFTASETSQLNFGRFSPGPQGGEIILTPQSTISVLGSIYKGSGTHNAASFYITGEIDGAYSISLPAGPVVLTHVSSAKTMQIDNWVSTPAPGIGTGMLHDGFQIVYVGATLKVGTLNDNPVGIYLGSYTVTFDFN
jgi:hypothetical protein